MVYVIGTTSNTPDHLRNTTQFSMLRHTSGKVLNKTPLVYRNNGASSRRASMVFIVRKYDPATGTTGGFQGSKDGSDIVNYKKMVANTRFVNSCKTTNAKNCNGNYLFIKSSGRTCASSC